MRPISSAPSGVPARRRPLATAGHAGLAVALAALAACSSSTTATTFDLTAPKPAGRSGGAGGQIAVPEPTTIQALEGERIIVKDSTGAISYLGGGQWSDRLPRLIQARLIQTFENGSRIRTVNRPGERVLADYQLNTELRAFQVDAGSREAVVELAAKLVNDRTGRVINGRIFSSRAPVATIDAAAAAQALNKALSNVLVEVVLWTGRGS